MKSNSRLNQQNGLKALKIPDVGRGSGSARRVANGLAGIFLLFLLFGFLPASASAQGAVKVGKGCTTAFFIDKDCDGHGIAVRSDGNYGPGNVTGIEPYATPNVGDMPDADDNDPDVNTVESWRIKYGSGPNDTSIATLRAFLLASRGYNPTRIAFVDPVNGNN